MDAFSVPWVQDKPYLFPPFILIGRALTNIQIEAIEFACLIAPAWTAQIWYPQLLKSLVRAPILLPVRPDILQSPDQIPHPLLVEERMFLAAWPISGRDSLCRAFQQVTNILLQSWREHTHTAYNSAWKKWCSWCITKQVNPLSATLADILEFLIDNFELGLQYRTLNTLRSAISMTHSRVDDCTVGTHPLVVRLLKGMFNERPPVPRYTGS